MDEVDAKDHLVEFVFGRPKKNYAYKTSKGKEMCNVSLHYINSNWC